MWLGPGKGDLKAVIKKQKPVSFSALTSRGFSMRQDTWHEESRPVLLGYEQVGPEDPGLQRWGLEQPG